MGMFDTVVAPCPACGVEVEFQTKSGPCELKRYSYKEVPPDVAYGALSCQRQCKCGVVVVLDKPTPFPRVCLRVNVFGDTVLGEHSWD